MKSAVLIFLAIIVYCAYAQNGLQASYDFKHANDHYIEA